jgi:hypothetical protein
MTETVPAPIDNDRALALLRHLGVKVVKHRNGEFSYPDQPGSRTPTLLELLEIHWVIASPHQITYTACGLVMHDRSGRLKPGDPMPEEAPEQAELQFRTWLHEQLTALERNEHQQIARPLPEIARLIREQLQLAHEAAEPYWLEVGKLLLEAKPQLAHGQFGGWCKEHFKISATQRARYMRAAESAVAVQNFRNGKSSLEDYLKGTSYANNDRARPQQSVNLQAIGQDHIKHAEERKRRAALATKLIERGYKALAAELHPDKGGSQEDMTRLNEVRTIIRRCTAGIAVFD